MSVERIYPRVVLAILVTALACGVFLGVQKALRLPFRAANDWLHANSSPVTLDFLIPGGRYIPEDMRVGEVLWLRLEGKKGPMEKGLQAFSETVPLRCRIAAGGVLFGFLSLVYLTFFRVFTWMGYGRALRSSLLLGGITYLYMPDLSPGYWDDAFFLGGPLALIIGRMMFRRWRKPSALLLLFLLALSFSVMPALWAHSASGQADPGSPKISHEELQRVVDLLEDPVRRERFLEDLRALMKMQAATQGGEPAGTESAAGAQGGEVLVIERLLVKFETVSADVIRAAGETYALAQRAPLVLKRLASFFADPKSRGKLLALGYLVIGALFAAMVVGRILRAPAERILLGMNRQPGNMFLALLRVMLAGLPYVVLVTVLFLASSVFSSFPVGRSLALFFFTLLLCYRVVVEILRVLVAPGGATYRVLPLSEEDAGYAWVWGMRLLHYGFFYTVLVQALLVSGLPEGAYAFIRGCLLLGFPMLLSVFFLQVSREVRLRLERRARAKEGPGTHYRAVRRAAWYGQFVLIAYAWAFFVPLILGLETAFQFLLGGTLRTGVTFALLWFALRLVEWLFGRLFSMKDTIRMQFPGLEEKADRYIRVFRGVVKTFLMVVAAGVMAQIWGVPVRAMVGSEIGSMVICRGLVILLTVGLGIVVLEFSQFLRKQLLKEHANQRIKVTQKTRTLIPMLHAAVKVTVWFAGGVIVLDRLGLSVGPILAGAGILGLAVGFGSQTLVKDLINGLFILFEDSIRVGDWVSLGDKGGNVEAVSIRSMRLRDLNGNVHVIPNSSIDVLTNLSKEFSRAVLDVGIAYREDVDEVIEVLKAIGDSMLKDPEFGPDILEPLQVLGLDRFEDSAVVVRVLFTTRPLKQWGVKREFNRRMKRVFDERGIEIPFPHRTVYMGEPKTGEAPPLFVRLKGAGGGKGDSSGAPALEGRS